MPSNALYTDLSGYYELMCAEMDYAAQSHCARRLHRLFGNGGKSHLDLACGTGPHIRHFIDAGYNSSGLDINQSMLDLAALRCPEAHFSLQDMSNFQVAEPVDLISCFLYSIHYNDGIENLKNSLRNTHAALNSNGVFCFNAVDKNAIDNRLSQSHTVDHDGSRFVFRSGWNYCGQGDKQTLKISIEKNTEGVARTWQEEHAMVAVSFGALQKLLQPWFEVHLFEHDYDKLTPWEGVSGNALFVCVKKQPCSASA